MRPQKVENIPKLECVETETELTLWLWSTLAAHPKQMQRTMPSRLYCEKTDIAELNDDKLVGSVVWGDRQMLRVPQDGDGFRDPNYTAEAGRAGPGNDSVRIL